MADWQNSARQPLQDPWGSGRVIGGVAGSSGVGQAAGGAVAAEGGHQGEAAGSPQALGRAAWHLEAAALQQNIIAVRGTMPASTSMMTSTSLVHNQH